MTQLGQVSASTHSLQIDYVPLTHAIHRVSGIVSPANPAATAVELEQQLRASGSVALFTCIRLLPVALKAAQAMGIPKERIFILPMQNEDKIDQFTTIHDLIEEGKSLPELKLMNWSKGQGARQVAYLCFSSGTSGLPVR